MNQPQTENWITISDAAELVRRSPNAIYRWIHQGHLERRRDNHGVYTVEAGQAMSVEGGMTRGRPKGSARPRHVGATRRT